MKNKVCLSLILCLLVNLAGYSQSAVFESLSFDSQKLGRKVSYSIYLPSDYNTSKRNYPVLYLLHGYTDNETNWIHMGQMKTIADRAIANEEAVPMIIVMPDAWDTWYVNQYDGKVPYEDMFFEELIPYMEKTYRVRSNQESRAIAGLSMGGFQAVSIGLAHLDKFAHIGGFSGGGRMNSNELNTAYNGVFADAEAFNQKVKTLYISLGTEEAARFKNVTEFHDALTQANINHIYYESPGTAHEWLTWRRSLHQFAGLIFK